MFLSFFHCRVSQITRRLRQHHNQTVLDYKPQATPAEQDRLMSILDLVKNSSNHLPEKAGYDFQQRCSEAGLQKVGTAGTGGTGKKNDLLGKKCLFSTLSYTFLMENLRFILVVVRGSKIHFAVLLWSDFPFRSSSSADNWGPYIKKSLVGTLIGTLFFFKIGTK